MSLTLAKANCEEPDNLQSLTIHYCTLSVTVSLWFQLVETIRFGCGSVVFFFLNLLKFSTVAILSHVKWFSKVVLHGTTWNDLGLQSLR